MKPAYLRSPRRCLSLGVLIGAAVATTGVTDIAYGVVEVNVTRVGFPALGPSDVVRAGSWVPIVVDLALLDQAEFHGSVRVGQFDVDGDECYDRVDVHLRAETGGAQRVVLYALPNPLRNRGRFLVELFDDEGNVVEVVTQGELEYQAQPAQLPETIPHDDILILSISTGTIGRVRDLAGPEQENLYIRPIRIGHMSPSELPELWIGLEMVDYVVWDDARPEQLTERRIRALLEWVRHGGTLLIAASRSVGSLKLNRTIEAALPVDIGDLVRVDNLPEVRKALLTSRRTRDRRRRADDVPWWDKPFDTPVSIVKCTLRDGATRIPNDKENESNVIARRRLGRGHVIFCAVTLQDLFSAPGSPSEFFQALFHLPVLQDETDVRSNSITLFPQVVSAVAFTQRAGLYLAMIALCSVGYVFLATFGSWALLGARGWRHHCWSTFAVVSITASLLTVFAVSSVRGFGGRTLHQISIVDVDAGDSYGFATAFFGVKTGLDTELDLWLPSDPLAATEPGRTNCFLRPLPVGNDPAELSATFADPEEYRLVPASAVVDDVRIRGTLKRFEGRWEGPLGGTLTGDIAVEGLRILDGSYVINNLGVDLHDCYLLHTGRDFARGTGFRSSEIYAYPIGDLRSDGSKLDLVPRCYRMDADESLAQLMNRSTLAEAQQKWGSTFRSILTSRGFDSWGGDAARLGQGKNALLLLTTLGEYDPKREGGLAQVLLGATTWSRDRCRRLDLHEQFRRDSVILLGFTDDPGPLRLFSRTGERPYRVLTPDSDHSWTLYRIRIPVTLVGREKEEGDDRIR